MASKPEPASAQTMSGGQWPDGFVDFYRRHFDAAVRVAGALVGRPDIAQEITQDAFVALARRWEDVDSPYGYLRRCIVNAAHDYRDRSSRHRRLVASQRPETVDPPEVAELDRLLDGLRPRRKAALALRFLEDLDYAEIAQILECRPTTARSLVHRGLKDLRRKMS